MTELSGQGPFVHRIDGSDAIVYVNDEWVRFAKANDAPGLTRKTVLHRCLWDFIASPEVAVLHQSLANRVRALGKSVRLPFRCDSPGLRRCLEMEVIPLGGGGVEYRCWLIHVEARPPVSVLRSDIPRTDALVRICSWCRRIEAGEAGWVELEEGIRRLGLFEAEAVPGISHTICDVCLAVLTNEPGS